MIYTEVGIRIKSGFKKVVLTQKLVFHLNQDHKEKKKVGYISIPLLFFY